MQTTEFPRPKKRKTLKVETPEWEDGVYVAKLSGDQLQRVQDLLALHGKAGDPKANGHMGDVRLMVELAVVFTCNEEGVSMLTEDDVPRLLKEEFDVFRRIVDEGFEFNNMAEESMERVAKNLPATSGAKHG